MRSLLPFLLCALLAMVVVTPASAQQNAFDLSGPTLVASVTRDGASLPIGRVPALEPGDRLSIRADLPRDHAARYRLVLAFLRGPTNPPEKDWFVEAETWKKKGNAIDAEVPEGAEQAVLLLAPDTSGSFDAIKDAVRGRPGVFVRAAQDLHQASLDRGRLEAFVASIARIEAEAPERLGAVSPILADAFGIKLNTECLTRQRALQAACLTQGRDTMILQTSPGSSLTETLTGAPVDVAYRIAATPEGGAGYYSPYIGLARDLARLFGAFRSAQYQYVPALALADGDRVRLQLNTAPSFRNPRSALVVPMPPIGPPAMPVWRPVMKGGMCIARPGMVVPLEGAQLLFSTGYAGDLGIDVTTDDGRVTSVPAIADASQGGITLSASAQALPARPVTAARVRGRWGFTPFTGPSLPLQAGAPEAWTPQPDAEVIVGRDHPLLLRGGASSCVQQVALKGRDGAVSTVPWKPSASDEIEVTLPLARTKPSTLSLLVAQYGAGRPATIPLVARAEASRLERFAIHAGDPQGTLTGTRLDQVEALTIGDQRFVPQELTRASEGDRLVLAGDAPVRAAVGTAPAKVTLRDGRNASVTATIAPARPTLALLSRSVAVPETPGLAMTLPETIVPIDGTLTFSVRRSEGAFELGDVLEIAGANGGGSARLTVASGAVQRAGGDVAVASVQPRTLLGPSVTGPLRLRAWRDGVASDWQPLATVARLPKLDRLDCTAQTDGCTLIGRDLFVVSAIGTSRDPGEAKAVPRGFVDDALRVPHPADGALYLQLHDAPGAMVRVGVPAADVGP